MAFEVLDQNISQLFKNDDIFFIPRYQRNYVWKELNWEQLIKDIRYCAEVTPDWSHFIGSMVFERRQPSGGMVAIIDGQQRMLTLQVVIFALMFSFKRIKEKSDDENLIKQCDANLTYLRDLIINRTLGNEDTVKIENGYEEYIELNETLMNIDDNDLQKYESLIKEPHKEKNIILRAFKFFVNDFYKLEFSDLALLSKQFLETRVVTISSMQEEEVYNIFEILNARGVKLKQVELLKNFLFKYLKPKSELDVYKSKWKKLEETLEGIDLDDYYLHMFRCWYYKNKLKKEQLFEVTKEQLRNGSSEKLTRFFDFFIRGCEYYKSIDSIRGDEVEKEVYEYYKLKKNKQVRSVLLALKIQNTEKVLNTDKYHEMLIMLRNFYVVFNLDNGVSNKIDNDIYVLSNEIFRANDFRRIEFSVLRFLKKFSTYFNRKKVFEDGLKNIVYSNKSTRKNISSKLIIYFLKPLLLEAEQNRYVHYDFSKFNVEHVLNDKPNDEKYYMLGNLLICPEDLNEVMRNSPYSKKRIKMLESNIPYLVRFANQYLNFGEGDIEERNKDVVTRLGKFFLLSEEKIDSRYKKLENFFSLKEQLIRAFGENSQYVIALDEKGIDQFIEYIYKNGSLPDGEVGIIKKLLPQIA